MLLEFKTFGLQKKKNSLPIKIFFKSLYFFAPKFYLNPQSLVLSKCVSIRRPEVCDRQRPVLVDDTGSA